MYQWNILYLLDIKHKHLKKWFQFHTLLVTVSKEEDNVQILSIPETDKPTTTSSAIKEQLLATANYKMCRDCSSKQSRKDPEYKWRHVLVRSRSITLGKTLKVRSLRKKFLYCLLAQTKTIILRNFLEPAVSSTIWGSYIIGYELFCWCSSSIWLFY